MARLPFNAMNNSKTRRSPHKGTESHRTNKYLFRILPALWCYSRWIHRLESNRWKISPKPKWKNYDYTMFLSRITASQCIAVKWFLKVYCLLPLSIVDSFAEHRRFFCWAPWILGPINQLHFPKKSFPYFSRLFFSSSTTATSLPLSSKTQKHLFNNSGHYHHNPNDPIEDTTYNLMEAKTWG